MLCEDMLYSKLPLYLRPVMKGRDNLFTSLTPSYRILLGRSGVSEVHYFRPEFWFGYGKVRSYTVV